MRKAWIILLLGILFTACSRPPAPDFNISLNPPSLTIEQGNNGTTTLTLTPQGGFSGEVSLSLEGAPIGVTLSPGSIQVTGPSALPTSLTLTVAPTVDAMTYRFRVRASSGNINKTADLSLTVDAPTGTETLSGVVVSENAGAPVAGSQVRLFRGNTLVASTITNPQGTFTFANIVPGTYRIEVQKPGMAGSIVEGVRVPGMSFVRVIQMFAFDTSASTTPPALLVTQDGSQPLEGGTYTDTIPFRVQVDPSMAFVRPMRLIFVALGRTPGAAFISNTPTSSRLVFAEVEDTGNRSLSGTAVAGLGSTAGEELFLEVVAYDFNRNRRHRILPLTFINTAPSQNNTVSNPSDVTATAITLGEAVGFFGAGGPYSLTVPLGRGQAGEMLLDPSAVPEGSNLYVEVRWCYTAAQTPFAFDIERSQDNQNWTKVGTVGGARNANCPSNPFDRPFFFRDISPDLTPGQTYYYRVVARGANRVESASSSTTPLPPFLAPLLSPADESTGVSKTPDFIIRHPQLAIGADGAAYNLVLWDTLTGGSVAWQTLRGSLLLVEFGTGSQGNGVPPGEALVYGFPGGTFTVYTDTAGLLDANRPSRVPVNLAQNTVTMPYNFDSQATLPQLQSLRTYAWQLWVSYAYKYNPAEARISAYSIQTWPSSTSFIRITRLGTQVFDFTTGE